MLLKNEIIVDSFAGGGGASTGIERALGRPVDVAINHNPLAIAMHATNHPKTRHFTEDVFKLKPRQVTGGKPVGLLWASPDCRHFSRAKGSKPVKKEIRGLAWVVVKWAAEVRPRVIILENVREFQDWGPLVPRWKCGACEWTGTEGQVMLGRRSKSTCPRCESRRLVVTEEQVPCPNRKGLTFRQFTGRLKAQGYAVDHRVLDAADFGAPTHRKRLFLVARRDGEPIQWPEPTHGDPKKIGRGLFDQHQKPWRTAAECIDWSIPCPSIFTRKKPLAEKTLKRIALGIKRYVLDNPKPFIVDMQRENRERGTDEPLGTVTTQGNKFNLVTPVLVGAGGSEYASKPRAADRPLGTIKGHNAEAVVTPVIVPVTHAGERRSYSPEEPLPTVTGANRGELACVTPFVARIGQTGGNGTYCRGAEEPLTTITSKSEHLLIAPVIAHLAHGQGKSGPNEVRASGADEPINTIHAGGGNFALLSPHLTKFRTGSVGSDIEEPVPTVTANSYVKRPGGAAPIGLVSAFLARHFGKSDASAADAPAPTITAGGMGKTGVVAANLVHLNHGDDAASGADEPMRAVTAGGNHAALVYAFLVKYFGVGVGQPVNDPLHTVTAKDRFGLITVMVDGEPHVITDIGMRMLRPRELANAQGFPADYVLTGTATNQVERIGNSVCPDVAAAVVAANLCPAAVPA